MWMKTVGIFETEDISKKKICDISELLHCGGNAHSFKKESSHTSLIFDFQAVTYTFCDLSSRKKKTYEF